MTDANAPSPPPNERTKAEQAAFEFETALKECTSGVEQLMSSSGPLSSAEKYTLCRSIGEECIQDQELFNLLDKKPEIVAYDGFEPSGRMHIAQGVMKALNVNKLTKCGVHFKFWVADWYVREREGLRGGDVPSTALLFFPSRLTPRCSAMIAGLRS